MPNYNAMIAELQAEMNSLLEQEQQLAVRIAELEKAMDSIRTLAEEEITLNPPPLKMDSEAGFTDRVRAVLQANPALALTAVLIRDEFLKTAVDEDPKILLIHTHNTLKRLSRQGEVEVVTTSAGTGYRWKYRMRNSLADRLAMTPPPAQPDPPDNPPMHPTDHIKRRESWRIKPMQKLGEHKLTGKKD